MSNTENSQKTYFCGRFNHGVDDKRRLQVPAKWRPEGPEAELLLIPWPNGSEMNSHLVVLPPPAISKLAEKIEPLSLGDPKAAALRRLIVGNSASVTLDKAGRVCIPEEIAELVDIKDKVVLVGMMDRFEIWNPERLKAAQTVDAALLGEALKLI